MTLHNAEKWLANEFDEFVRRCIPTKLQTQFRQSAYITGNSVIRDLVNAPTVSACISMLNKG